MKATLEITESGMFAGYIYDETGQVDSCCLGNTNDYVLRWFDSHDVESKDIEILLQA